MAFPRPSHLLFGLMLAAALVPGRALAEADALVREALSLTTSGQAKQAFDLLSPQEVARAGDPDFDTVLGIAANETGQYTRAVFALERVLAVQPGNARARAELGRALFAVGDTQAARALLQQTKDQGVPVEAAQTIDQFLQAIDRVEESGRSSLKGYAEASIGHDSNVNSGPGISNVAVPAFGGLVLTLNPGGVKTSAGYATVGGGLSGRYVIDPRWSLIGNVNGSFRHNSGGASQFDIDQLDANAGASYRVERNEYTLVAQVGTYGVGHERLRDQAGLVGEWTYRLDGYRQFNTYLQLSRLTYPQQRLRDVDRNVIGGSYAHLFRDSGLLAFGGLYLGEEKVRASGVPHLGHKLFGLRAGVQKPFSETLAIFLTGGYEDRRFGGDDPLFMTTRHDKQSNLNLGLSWAPAKAWRVTPQLAYVRTKSNVPIADYDKTMVSVTVRREF
ncbi:surface lipoprotein assembly modifier [Variovorax terrae]|uniref:Surface lipoprotein assembly modifier n=1 Tax=Variovorax terrae TaxID=2923278 RepID=A0A9X1VUN5_9BURK|nr:surface lipoprotein assembly modifier [Variovorax terrae]MCJ0763585.1 surface lipoprotein assembly modifier [Variovorax terrae]